MLAIHRRRLWSAGIVAVLALTHAPGQAAPREPAAAAAKPKAADVMKARFAAAAGDKALKKRAYDDALARYRESYGIDPQPAALRGIAEALRGQEKYPEAYEAYAKVLAIHDKDLKPKDKAEVGKALAALEQLTATVELKTPDLGADVSLDDGPKLATPLAGKLRVRPGKHQLRIAKEGFEPILRELELSPAQAATVEVKLEPVVTTGHVSVRPKEPAEVHVIVDGADVGPAPWEGDLPPGAHTIELSGPGRAAPRQTLEVAKKERYELVLDVAPTTGRLELKADPPNATLSIDGKIVGNGAWEGDLEPGKHKVELAAEGHQFDAREVEITAGETTKLEVVAKDLAPAAPAAVEPKEPGPERSRGMYGGFDLFGAWPAKAPSYKCPSRDRCDTTEELRPIGAGAVARAGMAFDPFAAEVVLAFLGGVHHERNSYPGAAIPSPLSTSAADFPRQEDFVRYSLGVFGGVGGRVSSRGSPLRFSAGTALGVAYRHFTLSRNETGSIQSKDDPSSDDRLSQSDSYVRPALLLDGAVLLGATPGVKLRVGLLAWIDFAPGDFATPAQPSYPVSGPDGQALNLSTPSYRYTTGTQFFFGPTLGMQFGH